MNKLLELLLRDARENKRKRDNGTSWEDAPCQFCDLAKQEHAFQGFSQKSCSYCAFCLLQIKGKELRGCMTEGRKILNKMENYFDE